MNVIVRAVVGLIGREKKSSLANVPVHVSVNSVDVAEIGMKKAVVRNVTVLKKIHSRGGKMNGAAIVISAAPDSRKAKFRLRETKNIALPAVCPEPSKMTRSIVHGARKNIVTSAITPA